MPTSHSSDLLGTRGAEYLAMVDELSLDTLTTPYSFMDPDSFKHVLTLSTCIGMKTYWQEILFRAHMSAVTAVLRTRRWFSAVLQSRSEANLLAFAAALRGLIESAADSATSLRTVPLALAGQHVHIQTALRGRLDQIVVCSALENELIHFSHARFIPKQERCGAPSSHQARRSTEYLGILADGGLTDAIPCYRTMCDLMHPGAPSVHMWLEHQGDTGRLCGNRERTMIAAYTADYKGLFLELLMFGFNPAVMILGVLNFLPLTGLHTPRLATWNLDGIGGWNECLRRLNDLDQRV